MTKEELKFKKTFKNGACLSSPITYLIPANIRKETLLAIKNELLDKGLESHVECPKRFVCQLKGKCLGRPLEVESKTAQPYLKQLELTGKVVNGEYFVEGCETCPIAKTCSKTCFQVDQFVNRHRTQEPYINYRDNLEISNFPEIDAILDVFGDKAENLEIPYDCLNEVNKEVIRMYLYEQRDFASTAKATGLANGAAAKKMFYYSLNQLAETANMRKFITEGRGKLTYVQLKILEEVYLNNKSLTDVAYEMQISKQSVSQTIAKVIENNNIKIPRFVKKSKDKVTYNVPLLFKE